MILDTVTMASVKHHSGLLGALQDMGAAEWLPVASKQVSGRANDAKLCAGGAQISFEA